MVAAAVRTLEGCAAGACASIERREAAASLVPSELIEKASSGERNAVHLACVVRRATSLGSEFWSAIGAGLKRCLGGAVANSGHSLWLMGPDSIAAASKAILDAIKSRPGKVASHARLGLALIKLWDTMTKWIQCGSSLPSLDCADWERIRTFILDKEQDSDEDEDDESSGVNPFIGAAASLRQAPSPSVPMGVIQAWLAIGQCCALSGIASGHGALASTGSSIVSLVHEGCAGQSELAKVILGM